MDIVTDLVLAGALAAVWTAAGLVADGLQTAGTAAELRRRAGRLSALVMIGAAVFVAVPTVMWIRPGEQQAPTAAMLAAIPGLVVLTLGVRRLGQVRRGAGAFTTAPLTPVPPALRAAAAHPLIIVPMQVTGLAALLGVPIAARVVEVPASNVAGIAITIVGVAVIAIGIRAAVRHSGLSLLALAPISRGRPRGPVSSR